MQNVSALSLLQISQVRRKPGAREGRGPRAPRDAIQREESHRAHEPPDREPEQARVGEPRDNQIDQRRSDETDESKDDERSGLSRAARYLGTVYKAVFMTLGEAWVGCKHH